jgi:hypothetical protein
MTREEVKEDLTKNSPLFQKALKGNVLFSEHMIDSEFEYLNSEYGKKHKYPEIPISEVD